MAGKYSSHQVANDVHPRVQKEPAKGVWESRVPIKGKEKTENLLF